MFGISTVNPEKISVIQNGGTIFDSGLIPVTDKSWFTLKGDAVHFICILRFTTKILTQ